MSQIPQFLQQACRLMDASTETQLGFLNTKTGRNLRLMIDKFILKNDTSQKIILKFQQYNYDTKLIDQAFFKIKQNWQKVDDMKHQANIDKVTGSFRWLETLEGIDKSIQQCGEKNVFSEMALFVDNKKLFKSGLRRLDKASVMYRDDKLLFKKFQLKKQLAFAKFDKFVQVQELQKIIGSTQWMDELHQIQDLSNEKALIKIQTCSQLQSKLKAGFSRLDRFFSTKSDFKFYFDHFQYDSIKSKHGHIYNTIMVSQNLNGNKYYARKPENDKLLKTEKQSHISQLEEWEVLLMNCYQRYLVFRSCQLSVKQRKNIQVSIDKLKSVTDHSSQNSQNESKDAQILRNKYEHYFKIWNTLKNGTCHHIQNKKSKNLNQQKAVNDFVGQYVPQIENANHMNEQQQNNMKCVSQIENANNMNEQQQNNMKCMPQIENAKPLNEQTEDKQQQNNIIVPLQKSQQLIQGDSFEGEVDTFGNYKCGILTFANGNKFTGIFHPNGIMSCGTYEDNKNNIKYCGTFSNKGVFQDGDKTQIIPMQTKMVSGIIVYPNGDHFSGIHSKDQKTLHSGVYIYANGNTFSGVYHLNGKPKLGELQDFALGFKFLGEFDENGQFLIGQKLQIQQEKELSDFIQNNIDKMSDAQLAQFYAEMGIQQN